MATLAPSVAAVRTAVRRALTGVRPPRDRAGSPPSLDGPARNVTGPAPLVLVACSGGADSLALAAATAFVAPRLGLRAGLVTVDHGLQPGSAGRAAQVAHWAGAAGLDPVEVATVSVAGRPGGPEAAARQARYQALTAVARRHGAAAVLLGHTRDDQAETVLLALARGSGPRGLAGMPLRRVLAGVVLLRPLLDVSREQTRKACAVLGLTPWEDPHNTDPAYARARVRAAALPALVHALGAGTVENLARTAALLAADNAVLDALAGAAFEAARAAAVSAGPRRGAERGGTVPGSVEPGDAEPGDAERGGAEPGGAEPGGAVPGGGALLAEALAVPVLRTLAPAVRTRVLHAWAHQLGAAPAALGHRHVAALDALVTDWHGQGPVHLPGAIRVARRHDLLVRLAPADPGPIPIPNPGPLRLDPTDPDPLRLDPVDQPG